MKVKVAQSCPTPFDPMDYSCQAPLSMEFSMPEYWSGQTVPSPGYLPDPGIELGSPDLQADSSPAELQRSNSGYLDSILGQDDPLEEGMVTHSSILVWMCPWTEEPDQLLFIVLQRLINN